MSVHRLQPHKLHRDQRTMSMILRSRLDPEEAAQRARMLVEDMARCADGQKTATNIV